MMANEKEASIRSLDDDLHNIWYKSQPSRGREEYNR